MARGQESPLALDPETMRRLGYRTVDMLVDRLTGPPGPVVQAFDARGAARAAARCRRRSSRRRSTRSSTRSSATCCRSSRASSHPGYLAFIPGEGTWPGALGDLIASALNMDTCWWLGASGPSALELTVLEWFRRVGRLPGGRRGRARLGRVGGEPDGARMRARGADRRDGRPRGRLHVRPDALVAGAGGPRAGVPPRPGAGHPDRPASARLRPERCAARSPPTSAAAAAAGRDRKRGRDRDGRGRPVRASWRRSAASTTSGCTSTAPTARSRACPSGQGGARRHGARRLDHARPAQVALPARRGRRAARARRRAAASRLRDHARLPRGHRGRRRTR